MKRQSKAIVRNPLCGLLKRDLQKQGLEVQIYAYGPENTPVHAGVHWVPEITARWLYKLEKHWARWRRWYDNLPENRKRDYPAKHNQQVLVVFGFPVDDPKSPLGQVLAMR